MKRDQWEKLRAAKEKASREFYDLAPSQRECCGADGNHGVGLEWDVKTETKERSARHEDTVLVGYRLVIKPAGHSSDYLGIAVHESFMKRALEVKALLDRWWANEGEWPLAKRHKACEKHRGIS